jgi:hypothetical protein
MQAARDSFDASPTGIAERARHAINGMLKNRGDE